MASTHSDDVYVFNKRLMHMIGMLAIDCPGDPFVQLVKTSAKTIKSVKKDHLYNVYIEEIVSRFGDAIKHREAFFMHENIEELLPMAAWFIPHVQELYLSLSQERIDEYWKHICKLASFSSSSSSSLSSASIYPPTPC